ncbi:SCO6880 family protein [Longispora sp. NPDC051575]|uniref:SCO6880 family protein n=1 Tax=Longispora sp. NPDC051575 TaxID=3154943 RepID=UPI0034137A14
MVKFQFPPRSTRGALLGFTLGQLLMSTAGLAGALAALNLAIAGHLPEAGGALAGGIAAITAGLLRIRGRRATEWLPIVIGALRQRATRQDRYRGAIFSAHPGEHLDMPGPLAGYVWLPATTLNGTTELGLLHHRAEHTVTAVLTYTGHSLVLADTGDQQRRLTDWAGLLNTLGGEYAEHGLTHWAMWSRTVPDAGSRAQRHLIERATDTTSRAYRSLAALTAAGARTAQRAEHYLVVVFDVRRLSREIASAGGGDAAVGVVIAEQLAGIASAVREAGVDVVEWLTPRGYAAVLRTQWDPASQPSVDLRAAGGGLDGVQPAAAGPTAAETVGWGTYVHDSGRSRTLWVHEMPRTPVGMTWLSPLLTPSGHRRTISLTAQPVPAALAALQSRRERVAKAGDELTKRKMRLLRTAREVAEGHSVEQIDREQAAGHTRYRYALLITVTALTDDALDRAVLAEQRRLVRAGCAGVVLNGEPDQAFFAGGLPLARGLARMRGPLT